MKTTTEPRTLTTADLVEHAARVLATLRVRADAHLAEALAAQGTMRALELADRISGFIFRTDSVGQLAVVAQTFGDFEATAAIEADIAATCQRLIDQAKQARLASIPKVAA